VPLLRGQFDDRFDEQELGRRYGSLRTNYEVVNLEDAEVALLPRLFEHTEPAAFRRLLSQASGRGLRTLVFGGDDLEPVMPDESVILLHPGPTRGAQPRADVLALPYILTDRANPSEPRPDAARPSVAFCGQGSSRRWASAAQTLRRGGMLLANSLRRRVVAPPLRGHVRLRSAAIRALSVHHGVEDHFVIRDQYRAGASSATERARTQAEFDDNLRTSSYALCVRGSGNFSARFVEALSFGRVPLFVDTDCVLPFEDEINWRARTVWVPAADVETIGDQLVAAHGGVLGDRDRSAVALRRLWEERLSQEGFFAHLPNAIRTLL